MAEKICYENNIVLSKIGQGHELRQKNGQEMNLSRSRKNDVPGWMDGWVDGWVDEWVDGWMGGWMDECKKPF